MNINELTNDIRDINTNCHGTINCTTGAFEKLFNAVIKLAYKYGFREKFDLASALKKDNYKKFVLNAIDGLAADELVNEVLPRLDLVDDYFLEIHSEVLSKNADADRIAKLFATIDEELLSHDEMECYQKIQVLESMLVDKGMKPSFDNIYHVISSIIYGVNEIKNVAYSKKQVRNYSRAVINLINNAFPIEPSDNEVLNDAQSIDYNINNPDLLTVRKSEYCRKELYYAILLFVANTAEYDYCMELFTSYKYILDASKVRRLSNIMVRNVVSAVNSNDTDSMYLAHIESAKDKTLRELMVLSDEAKAANANNIGKRAVALSKKLFGYVDIIIKDKDANLVFDKYKELIDNYDEDRKVLNELIRQGNVNVITGFLVKYYSYYLYPISDLHKIHLMNEEQRHALSTINNELRDICACITNGTIVDVRPTFELEKDGIDDDFLTEEYIKGAIENSKNIYEIFDATIENVYKGNNEKAFAQVVQTDIGQEAIKDKKKYIVKLFDESLDAYGDAREKFTHAQAVECYEKIKSNTKICDYIAVQEHYFDKFSEMFPFESVGGDFSFLVLSLIKCVERFLKEVLGQNFRDKIYRTKTTYDRTTHRTVVIGDRLNVPRDVVVTAEYLSEKNSRLHYEGDTSDFQGIECGVAYYALKFLHDNGMDDGMIDDKFVSRNIFNNEWISKVRNGYLHIDAIETMADARENKNKTGYWLMFAILNLPALYR